MMTPIKIQLSREDIYAPIEPFLPAVEEEILKILEAPNELSSEVIRYFFASKGKFLRPALCLFGASLSGTVPPSACRMAAALEIFHSATLIHDDIVDSASVRRNLPTVHVRWNPQIAVLVGDFLHDRAIGAVFRLKQDAVTSVFLETAGVVCDGEILELNEKNNYSLREDQYLTIVERKTAALLACCLETGALLAGIPREETQVLKRYGLYFGIAFQMIDDCLDFIGKENEFGKTLGADCAAGVLTLPLIRLISLVSEKKKSALIQIIEAGLSGKHLQEIVHDLKEYDALEYTVRKAREYADRARLELAVLKDHPVKRSLNGLLDYVLERDR